MKEVINSQEMLTVEPSIHDLVQEHSRSLPTPYYLLDESCLQRNLKIIADVRERCGAKSVLALKCFSAWTVFDLMRQYMDGTTSSSLNEARLGYEKFGKETHAYSVAFSDEDVKAILPYSSKIIFNSVSQLRQFYTQVNSIPVGLRINPGVSHSEFDLADPARRYSRLGATDLREIDSVSQLISGAMFHCNCENDQLSSFSRIVDQIASRYGALLKKLKWVSFGGGIYFTKEGYDRDGFCEKLAQFSRTFDVQVYLEPGEAAITQSGFFVTRVLDIVHNEMDIAVVDGAVETHMLDLLIYRAEAKISLPRGGRHTYTVAGRTCLAGDVFGTYAFPEKLKVGSLIAFDDAAGYTWVKKNWFNGVPMPALVVRRLDGRVELVKQFSFSDYLGGLS